MNKENLTQEYKTFLKGLEQKPLKVFLEDIKNFKEKENNYFKKIEEYLNNYFNKEILDILNREEFLKIFYLDPQAEYILKEVGLIELDKIKTLIYCYNCNAREFNKKVEENNLKNRLLKEGFIFNDSLGDLKSLDGLKVKVVMDFSKIGLMGSFDKTEEKEGKFFYSDYHNNLMLIPKRSRTKGFIVRGRFYYKII